MSYVFHFVSGIATTATVFTMTGIIDPNVIAAMAEWLQAGN